MKIFLGLGANLENPQRQMEGALARLDDVVAVSSLYRSAPVGGPAGQRDYLNAVALIDAEGSPFAALEMLHRIEADFGRVRGVRNGPRTLDLDILAIRGLTIISDHLTIPHPRIGERAFVLVPLAEIDPEFVTHCGWDVDSHSDVERVAQFQPERRGWGDARW